MAGANIDITEPKRTEEALRESQARLRAVLDQMPLGISIREARSLDITLVNNKPSGSLGDRSWPARSTSSVSLDSIRTDGDTNRRIGRW